MSKKIWSPSIYLLETIHEITNIRTILTFMKCQHLVLEQQIDQNSQ